MTVAGPLAGVRVIEVATHVFVPMAGALLAEWGANVIKVEHPVTGDPYRGLVTAGLHTLHDGVDPFFQGANRSQALGRHRPRDRPTGGRCSAACVAAGDVFTTNLRPGARRRLGIDVDDVRADNPSIIYVSGTAFGSRGPDAERGGYDAGAYWARSGMQALFTRPRRAVAGAHPAGVRRRRRRARPGRRRRLGPLPAGRHRRAHGRRLVAARRRACGRCRTTS